MVPYKSLADYCSWLLFIDLSSLVRIWLLLSIWIFNLNWHISGWKKSQVNVNLAHCICAGGTGGDYLVWVISSLHSWHLWLPPRQQEGPLEDLDVKLVLTSDGLFVTLPQCLELAGVCELTASFYSDDSCCSSEVDLVLMCPWWKIRCWGRVNDMLVAPRPARSRKLRVLWGLTQHLPTNPAVSWSRQPWRGLIGFPSPEIHNALSAPLE